MDVHYLIQVIIIAIVEGLTEFIPVSSTGHMVLAGELIGFKGPAESSFEIVIQLGAILAVCVVYWQRLWTVAVRLPSDPQARAFVRNVLLAFVPAMVIGAVAYKHIKELLNHPAVIAWALIIGGVVILLVERMQHRSSIQSVEAMPATTALGIGFAQCLAMIPGVSRSGSTIMAALPMGVERKTAAEFTFFLAIPTMAAATAKDLYENWHDFHPEDLMALGVGFAIAFLVAILVVRSLVAFVGRYGFAPFAWYRILIGGVALAWLYSR